MFPLCWIDSNDCLSAGMEKKRKEKETRFLVTFKKELNETASNIRAAREFDDYRAQIDKAFEEFTFDYAKIEDEIRAIWVKIVKAHAEFIVETKQQIETELQDEKEREGEQLLGIAYHKKADEAIEGIIYELLQTEIK
ncbi:hypothetical protein M422DRAFT_786284 [Sphaerobolus stellatus SS14]|uniref:Uncharacterized protein n=1 Tax=Sphaerobolus stellatus (strain SS14) TaxID=990650 RepID=A0A0C9UD71_SPHS4|nr:hypothetical protein M422DRAFT_786284 [Sphaerobolus stellatus SS14]